MINITDEEIAAIGELDRLLGDYPPLQPFKDLVVMQTRHEKKAGDRLGLAGAETSPEAGANSKDAKPPSDPPLPGEGEWWPDPGTYHGPQIVAANHEPPIDTVALVGRVDYQQTQVIDISSRLDRLAEDVARLQQRLTQLEVFANNLHQQQGVAREMAERQTRYSALDLAIKASGPGADGGQMTLLAEGFLAWLRGTIN